MRHLIDHDYVPVTPNFQAPLPPPIMPMSSPPPQDYLSLVRDQQRAKEAKKGHIQYNRNMFAESAPELSRVNHPDMSEPETAQMPPPRIPAPNNDKAFSTRASWYGPGFEGRRTASGARFNSSALTAASRTLPMGTRVLVANPGTGKCCTVTINDRGPYVSGRDIDLSRGAASRIGVTGVSPVVCVAYGRPMSVGESSATGGAQTSSGRRRSRRSRRSYSASSSPQPVSGRVMHLIAGIM